VLVCRGRSKKSSQVDDDLVRSFPCPHKVLIVVVVVVVVVVIVPGSCCLNEVFESLHLGCVQKLKKLN